VPLTAEIVEVVLKNLTDRIVMAVFFLSIVCFILMLFPFSVGDFLRAHWQWPFFGGLGALCYLPTRSVFDWNERREETNRQGERLRHLTKQEKNKLLSFVENGETTLQFYDGDAVVIGLQQEKILLHVYSGNQRVHECRLAPWARVYLEKRPHLLKP
jgi:Super-infection exclusion protein B